MRPFATFAAAALLLPAGLWLSRSEAAPAAAPATVPPTPLAAIGATDPFEGPVSGKFEIDGVHSSVLFGVVHAKVGRFWGRFNQVSGELTVDADKPQMSTVLVKIAAESVDTANDGRDNHLRGPDFFNAKEFPEIVFESTKIAKAGDGFEVSGDLTMLGVTKPINAKVKFTGHSDMPRLGKRSGYEVSFEIKRSDFGMKYGLPDVLGDDVKVLIALEAVLK